MQNRRIISLLALKAKKKAAQDFPRTALLKQS
jgi:hypothetical protein